MTFYGITVHIYFSFFEDFQWTKKNKVSRPQDFSKQDSIYWKL